MANLMLVVLVLHTVHAALDTTVCTPHKPQGQGHPVPVMPPSYEVHVECIIVNKNLTTEVHEYFDQDNNRGEARQIENGTHFTGYYDYNVNEFIGVLPDSRQCSVTDLSTSEQKFLFGFNATGLPPGHGRIFSASAALHFAGTMEVYVGKTAVRGINVDQWESCQYWPSMDASMNVTWYFSDPNDWNMALSLNAVPIRAMVKGVIGKDGDSAPHPFLHYYDFIHFKPFIERADAFETPSLVTCPGRKLTKPLPQMAQTFSFGIEILDEVNEAVSYMKEWYDNIIQKSKYVYKPSATTSDGTFGYRQLTEIHDFKTGIAYVMDNELGNCTIQMIEKSSFDDVTKDPFHVRMRTVSQFFYMNTTGVTYEGIKKAKGIPADVWVAKRSDFPPGTTIDSTFEWYFKTTDGTVKFVQDEQSVFPGGTPIQMRVDIPQNDARYTYNIYNFLRSPADIIHWDVTPCYDKLHIKKFQFLISGMYNSVIKSHIGQFKYATMQALSYYAEVDELRIAEITVLVEKDVQVLFSLLDAPPIFGDVSKSVAQTPLDQAASKLSDVINRGALVVLLFQRPGVRPITITPIASTLVELTEGTGTTSTILMPSTKKYVTPSPVVTTKVPPTRKPGNTHQAPHTTQTPAASKSHTTKGPYLQTTKQTHFNVGPTSGLRGCVKKPNNGYSAGVALGVSAIMMIIGGGVGTLVAVFIQRRKRIGFTLSS